MSDLSKFEETSLFKNWKDCTFVAFDTETSGAYPLGSEVVEFGAVKWADGKIVDELQFLAKPREPMTDFIMKIHGISNEMVEGKKPFIESIDRVLKFFEDCYLMAHHAAFDMGFLAVEIENAQKIFPNHPVLCTSLLSQKLIHGSENHKLQTLVKFLKLDGGSAHRALDDAKSCLRVGLHCFEKMQEKGTLAEIFKAQSKVYKWEQFAMSKVNAEILEPLKKSIQQKRNISIRYKKETRSIFPLGLVRQPDGDYISGICQKDNQRKRFFLNAIQEMEWI